MKKFAFLLIVAFVAALALSSCNKEACPAYSNADNSQTEQVG
ncbi:MAG: lipoprotein [Bacteroidia bacterium]|jgi:outer membrane protein assembly factor BamE (lipoprotein component of BamABCDE complex)|nr:lipoprotein [Bacteroidia bacterium]